MALQNVSTKNLFSCSIDTTLHKRKEFADVETILNFSPVELSTDEYPSGCELNACSMVSLVSIDVLIPQLTIRHIVADDSNLFIRMPSKLRQGCLMRPSVDHRLPIAIGYFLLSCRVLSDHPHLRLLGSRQGH